jgi:hypothetical protein
LDKSESGWLRLSSPVFRTKDIGWKGQHFRSGCFCEKIAQSFSPNLAQDGRQVCRPAQRSRVTGLCYSPNDHNQSLKKSPS